MDDCVEMFVEVGVFYSMGWRWVSLNPTGRWKVERNIYDGNDYLYIEHKRRFAKDWICETQIHFLPEGHGKIVDCSKGA